MLISLRAGTGPVLTWKGRFFKRCLWLAGSSAFRRWPHHVKIQLSPGSPARAKGYLAVAPAFVSDAELTKLLQPGA